MDTSIPQTSADSTETLPSGSATDSTETLPSGAADSTAIAPDGRGFLRVHATSLVNSNPIENANIQVFLIGNPEGQIGDSYTDRSGFSDRILLETPNRGYSMEPSAVQPYSEYNAVISAAGFENQVINGVQVFPGETALIEARLIPISPQITGNSQLFVIPPNVLFGDFPPKIAESSIKPVSETGEIVLSSVVIPEFIVVHDGPPTDSSAENYYVRYRDYVKNVASSEIYSTWPRECIIANILAIQSFTLNRVFTEWYRNRGYTFTITSSTAFDHKFVPGRNIFDSISEIVDEFFSQYITFPDVTQPLLAQYCDGKKVSCPNYMSQWGSKYLADQGRSAEQILRNYYGNRIIIKTAEEISGVPVSFPGEVLEVGSSSSDVRTIQNQLNTISAVYTRIPKIAEDGIFGEKTKEAVTAFQKIFSLPQSGIVDYKTWYKISEIYVAITKIAEISR